MSINLGSLTASALSTTPSPTIPPVAEDEEFYSSWSLFLVCMLLVLSLWTSYYLQIKRIRAVHETLVSIFAGMAVGLIVRMAPGTMIREMLTFKHTLFFNLLLPPIILNSGYELKQENFFRNFGSILIFAFFGTFISAVGVGVLVYVYSFLGLEKIDVTLIECLIFGSTLSATDPVTILAIFNQYKVDPKLYSVIFGESLLNDAVSIVMYETLTQFHGTEIYLSSIFSGIGIFLLSFSVSMALGVAFGLAMSLILKHSYLHQFPAIESCLVALSAYTCYFFSNGMSMSGIVSLLFCGITLKHYAYHTMSRRTQRTTKYMFQILAQLSENFIFIYLGMALFTSPPTSEKVTNYVKPLFIIITTVAVIFTRYAAVFPLSEGINLFHKHVRGQRVEELPHSYQMMLFWAGLRGAVGVALAAGFKGNNAQTLRTTVLVVVVLTVLMFGGTTARMLEVLGIRTGVDEEGGTSSDEEDSAMGMGTGRNWFRRSSGGRWNRLEDEPSYLAPQQTLGRPNGPGRIGTYYATRAYNPHSSQGGPSLPQDRGIFSATSSDSYDSDGEVLPMGGTGVGEATSFSPSLPARGGQQPSLIMGASDIAEAEAQPRGSEDGKWFQALDERYLLPIFSNATASRTFHARRARRAASSSAVGLGLGSNGGGVERNGSNTGTPVDSEDEGGGEEQGQEIELGGDVRRFSPTIPQQQHPFHGGGRSVSTPGIETSRLERGLGSPMWRSSSTGERG